MFKDNVPFTDEDLKRLKLFMKDDQGAYWAKATRGLIARLEAAELAIETFYADCQCECCTDSHYQVWRKAAGK